MRDALRWRIADAIDEFALHDSGAPVDLSALEEICPVSYEDIRRYGLVGWCVASEPASRRRPARVVICKSLSHDRRRLAYAHEAAHGLFGHSGAMTIADMDPWFADRQEREAWQAAAMLLIPPLDRVQLTEMTLDGLALACRVPRWLVDLLP